MRGSESERSWMDKKSLSCQPISIYCICQLYFVSIFFYYILYMYFVSVFLNSISLLCIFSVSVTISINSFPTCISQPYIYLCTAAQWTKFTPKSLCSQPITFAHKSTLCKLTLLSNTFADISISAHRGENSQFC